MTTAGGPSGGVAGAQGEARPLEAMTPAALENLERQTVSFLYALWGTMGVRKKIIRVESGGGYYTAVPGAEEDTLTY